MRTIHRAIPCSCGYQAVLVAVLLNKYEDVLYPDDVPSTAEQDDYGH